MIVVGWSSRLHVRSMRDCVVCVRALLLLCVSSLLRSRGDCAARDAHVAALGKLQNPDVGKTLLERDLPRSNARVYERSRGRGAKVDRSFGRLVFVFRVFFCLIVVCLGHPRARFKNLTQRIINENTNQAKNKYLQLTDEKTPKKYEPGTG